jgi:hypothetical protein
MASPKPNYRLRGTVEFEFYSPSDGAALSRGMDLVCRGEIGRSELRFLGKSVDEHVAVLERTDEVLCQIVRGA